jgi:two-component system, OmpR family, response regulator
MKVLVIDDNSEITDMLSFYLEEAGYECKVVNDGREGLKAIKLDDFDLVLLDLAMPEFSGMDVINSLKSDNLLEKKNIIILTASSLHEEETEALVRDGIRSVLKKPISIEELTSALQQFHR